MPARSQAADTTVHRVPDATTEVVGVYEGVAPGDQFYFVGNDLDDDPGDHVVRAIRVFVW
jgi:hypothetical protein